MARETNNDGELAEEVRTLCDEVRTLYGAIDELREQLSFMFNNRELDAWQPPRRPIKTMSLDPTARDFRVGYELPQDMPDVGESPDEETPREEEGGEPCVGLGAGSVEQSVDEDYEAFNDPPSSESDPSVVGGTTSSDEPVRPSHQTAADNLLIPERQNYFHQVAFLEWPPPERTPEVISVDRCDGPGEPGWRRFSICRGDTVRVRGDDGLSLVGIVSGIVPQRKQVCVLTTDFDSDRWYELDRIYPALRGDASVATPEFDPDSPTPVLECEADMEKPEHNRPYLLADYQTFTERLYDDELTADDVRTECRRLIASKDAFIAQLLQERDAQELRKLAARFGCQGTSKNNKKANGQAIFRSALLAFGLDQATNSSHFEDDSEEDAVLNILSRLTDGELHGYVEELNRQENE